ncbi:hydroxyethylthiazole kinase [Bacillus mesophilum]|uniref:Hydroxyethylthiazole kinase n=1 Tax=Bacillus mesophilum TaxID=1071718 RepID=A0A7V7RQT9_9BACI|nr:hydroxyethylthiazole kinase [Bacillus mesophilum]KAB2335849.1 hydroxyethylthiazole kinase [Bacillus mesophilum]
MEQLSVNQIFRGLETGKPLIHQITNNVTINDCANATLAIGASPVMATSIEEVEAMAGLADALVINFGTITADMYESMVLAGKAANRKGIPVVFDPVGVGATPYRTQKAMDYMKKVKVDIVRGNGTEVYALIGGQANTRGVDAGELSLTHTELAKLAAEKLNAVIVISGKHDAISDGTRVAEIENGDIWLTAVTGTGCMTTSLIASCAGVSEDYFSAAVVGMGVMSLAGERARRKISDGEGIGTFKVKLMDEIFTMNETVWEREVILR